MLTNQERFLEKNGGIALQELIRQKLQEIEQKEHVTILHCVESGSRAWGFASPNSDYDVRFIYVRSVQDYLRLEKSRDVIEWQLDETLDINGWDLQKALRLLYKSNPTLFEWSNSPIIYKTSPYWQTLKQEINQYFLDRAGMYHYLSTAYSNYKEHLEGEQVKLKKYFYVLRPILACKWILERHCPPPMLFEELVKTQLESEMRLTVETLVEQKRVTPELGKGPRIEVLNQYIEKNLAVIKQQIDAMQETKTNDWQSLNHLFWKALELQIEY